MEQKVLETVLTEILEEQKEVNKNLDAIIKGIASSHENVLAFKDHLSKVKLAAPKPDLAEIENKLIKQASEISGQLESFKSFIAQERRNRNIKDVIREWLCWLLAFVMAALLIKSHI